jgi:hypothetical protein
MLPRCPHVLIHQSFMALLFFKHKLKDKPSKNGQRWSADPYENKKIQKICSRAVRMF